MERSMGLYSMSSGTRESLSVEKGVLRSGNGKRSRCLEIKLKRCVDLLAMPIADRGVTQRDWMVNSRGKLDIGDRRRVKGLTG